MNLKGKKMLDELFPILTEAEIMSVAELQRDMPDGMSPLDYLKEFGELELKAQREKTLRQVFRMFQDRNSPLMADLLEGLLK